MRDSNFLGVMQRISSLLQAVTGALGTSRKHNDFLIVSRPLLKNARLEGKTCHLRCLLRRNVSLFYAGCQTIGTFPLLFSKFFLIQANNTILTILVAFWKSKQQRLVGTETDYAKAISINPAEGAFHVTDTRMG
jgi:hypothetical protein